MSALPIPVYEAVSISQVPGPNSGESLQSTLVRELQKQARGISRSRRAAMHRQFAQEWRSYVEAGFTEQNFLPVDYPLLRVLHNLATGRGEPILLK